MVSKLHFLGEVSF